MKNYCLLLFLLILCFHGYTQLSDSTVKSPVQLNKRDQAALFSQNARKAKKTGMILSIGGGSIFIIGILVGLGEILKDPLTGIYPDNSTNFASAVAAVGFLSAVASIPFFIRAGKQRKKARAMLYGDNAVSLSPSVNIPNSKSIGARLIIPLGK